MPSDAPAPRILIVEDNHDLQVLLSELLAADFQVASVGSGEEAVALARTFEPDLILLDYQLPGMNGGEVGRRIKEEAAPRFIPVLMLSALADRVDSEGLLAPECCDAFMAKPVPLTTIRAKVDQLLYSHTDIT